MIRFIFRFLGLLCLAAAFILVVYDGTKSIAGNALVFTSVRALWELINAASLAKLQPLVAGFAGGVLWDPVTLTLLGILGILFLLLGRRKRPLIGYERD